MSLVGIAMHQECFSMTTPVTAAADKHSCAAGRALIKLQCHVVAPRHALPERAHNGADYATETQDEEELHP